jgi:DNA-binding LacI/PurR family transcriptional regulator
MKRLISIPRKDQFVAAYSQIKELWSRSQRPRSIFFLDDVIADVALRAIMELDIKVPDELKIVTHANAGRNFYFPVPLTRIEFDPVDIMARTWGLLEKLITNQKNDQFAEFVRPVICETGSL